MKLGKRERALRRELMRYKEQARNRHIAVVCPSVNMAASGNVTSNMGELFPSQQARPRVQSVWTASKARSMGQQGAKVYS